MRRAMNSGLIGSWRLESALFEPSDSGERIDLYGSSPIGRLILTSAGRMAAILVRSDRSAAGDPAALYATMMAYSGTYHVDGAGFTTTVDVAWTPTWVGTEQARFFELEGDRLSLVTGEQTHPLFPGRPGRGRLTWRRENG